MIDIFFQASNFIVTLLFLVIVLYWLVVLFGAIDFDVIDFDLDVDVDADADVDGNSSNIFGLNKVLTFFNLGKIPFMVFLTFLVIPWWFATVIINHFFGFTSFVPGLLVLIPAFFGSLFVAKILTTPFVKIFAALDKGNVEQDILGTIGEVHIRATEERTGQGEFKLGGAFLNLKIRSKSGELNVGEKVMITNDKMKGEYYIVERYNEI